MPKRWEDTLSDREFAKMDAACVRVFTMAKSDDFSPNARAYVRRVLRRYNGKSTEVATRAAEYLELLAGRQRRARQFAYAQRNNAAVMRLYRLAVRLDPRNARAWEGLAHMHDKADRYAQAIFAAKKAMKYGDDPCATAIAARVLVQMGRVKEGEKLARSLARTRNKFAKEIRDDILKSRIWHPCS